MLIPMAIWEIGFNYNWCFYCGKVTVMDKRPYYVTETDKIFAQSCHLCGTDYQFSWNDSVNSSQVHLPDSFIIPDEVQLQELKKLFN